MGNFDQGSGTSYDLLTTLWRGSGMEKTVESCGIRWIAVQGSDSICALSSSKDKTMLKSFLQKLLKDEIVNPFSGKKCLDALRTGSRCFAVVSMTLGTDNGKGICDIEGASDYLNGRSAINFLQERLKQHSALTYDETIQTGISALQRMIPEGLDPNDIEVCVVKKDMGTCEPLPVKEIEKLMAFNSWSRRSKWKKLWRSEEFRECNVFFTIRLDGVPQSRFIDGEEDRCIDDCSGSTAMFIDGKDDSCIDDCSGNTVMSGRESKRAKRASNDDYARSTGTSGQEEKIEEERSGEGKIDQDEKESSHTHITLIWNGGWDYRLVNSSRFNWIGVLGNDSICVVTGDKIAIEFIVLLLDMDLLAVNNSRYEQDSCYLKNALLQMTDHPLSMKLCDGDEWSEGIPFAAVSVVNVHEESCHEVSTLGVNGKEAISFLTEKVEEELDFTREETIKTAFRALRYFWDDVKADDVQACVLRKGEEEEEQLSTTEIKQWLLTSLPPK